MRALARFRDGRVRVVERDEPTPDDGEVLVRTRRVGIDGTDRRVAAGEFGEPPTDEAYQVLGHEAVGVVEDANGTGMDEGQLVAPMVRRPAGDTQVEGPLDMAPPGTFYECGIDGAHGCLAERFTCRPEYLVALPESLAEYGFFVEPVSIVEKALDQAFAARSAFDWKPASAFVLGNGNLGLVALARLSAHEAFDRTYCLGRRDRPDPTIDAIESVGATYVDSRETTLAAFPDVHEPVDLVFETTGYAGHAVDGVRALAPNGVMTLQGVPTSGTLEVDAAAFHAGLVTHNRAVLGVVNSRRKHFEAAAEWLTTVPDAVLDVLVTGVYDLDEFEAALADDDETIKSVVSFEE